MGSGSVRLTSWAYWQPRLWQGCLLSRARRGPHLGMEDRQRLDGVKGDQDSNQELLVLSLQGQRKAIDDAGEGIEDQSGAQMTRSLFLPAES